MRASSTIATLAALCLLLACQGQAHVEVDGPGGYVNSCFVADTLVATPKGSVAIQSLEPGNLVLSYSLGDRKIIARKLVATKRSLRTSIVSVNSIRGVTPEHPIFSETAGKYVPAATLTNRDQIIVLKERGIILTYAEIKPAGLIANAGSPMEHEVYDLSVEGPEHNFFADGVLVHNKTWPAPLGVTSSASDQNNFYAGGASNPTNGWDEYWKLRKYSLSNLAETDFITAPERNKQRGAVWWLGEQDQFLFARGYIENKSVIGKISKQSGEFLATFSTQGIIDLSGSAYYTPIALDSNDIYAAIKTNNNPYVIRKYATADGALVNSFGQGGEVGLASNFSLSQVFVSGSALWLVGTQGTYPSNQWRIEKRSTSTGQLDATFALSGILVVQNSATILDAVLAGTSIFLLTHENPGNQGYRASVGKILNSGIMDNTFGTAGIITRPIYKDRYASRLTISNGELGIVYANYWGSSMERMSSLNGAYLGEFSDSAFGGPYFRLHMQSEPGHYIYAARKYSSDAWYLGRLAK